MTVVEEKAITAFGPLTGPLRGSIRVPGDKSISHRAVLFSAMAEGTSHVEGVLDSADVRSSMAAVSALGARVSLRKQPDASLAGTIEGWGARGPVQPTEAIDCGNSGTTSRLLMGVLAPWDISVELTGDSSLCRRPMRRIYGPLSNMGARFTPEGRECLPLTVHGTRNLQALAYESPVASAQLKTALLLAGVFAHGETSVCEPAPSRNHTELLLPAYGVEVEARDGYAAINGPAQLHAVDFSVPGDPSSAAFLVCAALMWPGSELCIEHVSLSPARIGFVRVLERMRAAVSLRPSAAAGREPAGDICVSYTPALQATEVQATEIAGLVDEVPILALVAACAQGTTVFREVGELRVKETDRLAAITEGLALLGVKTRVEGDDLYIEGHGAEALRVPAGSPGILFDSQGDHRLAMTFSLVGMCGLRGSAPVSVRDFESVAVSYPRFLNDIEGLVS